MACCQVCVFAFTAFLIVAERTARKFIALPLPRTTETHLSGDGDRPVISLTTPRLHVKSYQYRVIPRKAACIKV